MLIIIIITKKLINLLCFNYYTFTLNNFYEMKFLKGKGIKRVKEKND